MNNQKNRKKWRKKCICPRNLEKNILLKLFKTVLADLPQAKMERIFITVQLLQVSDNFNEKQNS